jgi:hypothetical protein
MNLLFDKAMFKAASNIPFSTNWENRFAKLLSFSIKGATVFSEHKRWA